MDSHSHSQILSLSPNHVAIATLLLESGADPNFASEYKEDTPDFAQPLFYAAGLVSSVSAVRYRPSVV